MKLKELRLKRGMTQNDIAKIFNIEQKTYSNYELEKTQPDIELLKKIANYFNVTLDYLCEREIDTITNNDKLANLALSKNQKIAIDKLLRLNDLNLLLAIAYCEGLYATQKEV